VELRLVATQKSGGLDVEMPKFSAGLPVGVHVLNWEFSATSDLFSCDMQQGGCPGTYDMKISVCELECELDTEKKHAGNAVLDQDSSHTFQVRFRRRSSPAPAATAASLHAQIHSGD